MTGNDKSLVTVSWEGVNLILLLVLVQTWMAHRYIHVLSEQLQWQ